MKSSSFTATSVELVQEKLTEIKNTQFTPTLAIIFSSTSYNLHELTQVFITHHIDMLACTSSGEICNTEVSDASIVVMLLDMNRAYYRLCAKETGSKSTYQIAFDTGSFAKQCFQNPAVIVFSGGMQTDAEQIIMGVKDGAKENIAVYGGLAGDDLRFMESFVFSNNWHTNDGLLTLIIDSDKISVEGMAVSGWESVGMKHIITKSTGNILYEVNQEPALDFFMKYFPNFTNQSVSGGTEDTLQITGQYPLEIIRNEGHSILRSILLINRKERSLILAGGVREEEQFRFSIAPGFEVVEKTVEEFSFLKDKCPQVDALIMVSCKARHIAFGPMVEVEVEGIYEQWQTPLIGLFSYGEIGKVKSGTCEFHNVTNTLITLKEKA